MLIFFFPFCLQLVRMELLMTEVDLTAQVRQIVTLY